MNALIKLQEHQTQRQVQTMMEIISSVEHKSNESVEITETKTVVEVEQKTEVSDPEKSPAHPLEAVEGSSTDSQDAKDFGNPEVLVQGTSANFL
jgi:hypothetical protein